MKEFKVKKKVFDAQEVKFIRVVFDNGEFIPFASNEIADMNVRLYDRLVIHNNDICPVAESGAIELNVSKRIDYAFDSAIVYDVDAYEKDRVAYIKNRFAQGGISYVMLFNDDNWHRSLHGNIVAESEGKNSVIKFVPIPNFGASGGEYNTICLNDIELKDISKIHIDFENCDSFTVYDSEIESMNIVLRDKLDWNSHDYCRVIESGYIEICFDEMFSGRQANIYFNDPHKIASIKKLKKRLCGKDRIEAHDICHLYITYQYNGYGFANEECLEVPEIFDESELRRRYEIEDNQSTDSVDCYFGGYARRTKYNTVLITFGKNAKKIMYEQLNRMHTEYYRNDRIS